MLQSNYLYNGAKVLKTQEFQIMATGSGLALPKLLQDEIHALS